MRILLSVFVLMVLTGLSRAQAQPYELQTGFRASRILNSYPNRQFPNAEYWLRTGTTMAAKFTGAKPAAVWIVSLYISGGTTQFNFPSDGRSHPYVSYVPGSFGDQNEAYLARFDTAGFRVWLQVEPGAASVDTLIDIVLGRYSHHPCVAGFGIDVEWLNADAYSGGRKLTDSNEVKRWETRVRSHRSDLRLFLKHYAQSWMPALYRGSVLFVDDSQQFPGLGSMVSEFKAWGKTYAPAPVAFQFGYPADTTWWKAFADPPLTIGSALMGAGITNLAGLFWVDFTITRVFPVTSVSDEGAASVPVRASLFHAYPNPFNGVTTILFSIPVDGQVQVEIYDVLGRLIERPVDGRYNRGVHRLVWSTNAPSGVYFCRLSTILTDATDTRDEISQQLLLIR